MHYIFSRNIFHSKRQHLSLKLLFTLFIEKVFTHYLFIPRIESIFHNGVSLNILRRVFLFNWCFTAFSLWNNFCTWGCRPNLMKNCCLNFPENLKKKISNRDTRHILEETSKYITILPRYMIMFTMSLSVFTTKQVIKKSFFHHSTTWFYSTQSLNKMSRDKEFCSKHKTLRE